MLFMIIERFQDNDMLPIYQRVRDESRMFPEGLKYIDSWVEPNFSRCFQLMECNDLRLLQEWILKWRGSGATFEIVPVVSSKETREVVEPFLKQQRTEPSSGKMNYKSILKHIKSKGYDGLIEMEHSVSQPGKLGEEKVLENYDRFKQL